jgi:CRP-like cAMP-binding protein
MAGRAARSALSSIDKRKFRFMLDEVPYFALYIMRAMARRIRALDANVGT